MSQRDPHMASGGNPVRGEISGVRFLQRGRASNPAVSRLVHSFAIPEWEQSSGRLGLWYNGNCR